MNRNERIIKTKQASIEQKTSIVLKIDTGLNREIFIFEKGNLDKYSLERFKGNKVRLSEEEWQAAQEFFNEQQKTKESITN